MTKAVVNSLIIFLIILFSNSDIVDSSGKVSNLFSMQLLLEINVLLIVNLHVHLDSVYYSYFYYTLNIIHYLIFYFPGLLVIVNYA